MMLLFTAATEELIGCTVPGRAPAVPCPAKKVSHVNYGRQR